MKTEKVKYIFVGFIGHPSETVVEDLLWQFEDLFIKFSINTEMGVATYCNDKENKFIDLENWENVVSINDGAEVDVTELRLSHSGLLFDEFEDFQSSFKVFWEKAKEYDCVGTYMFVESSPEVICDTIGKHSVNIEPVVTVFTDWDLHGKHLLT